MATETVPTTPEATAPTEKRYVAITLTDELRDALEKAAGDTSWGLYCRNIIAEKLGVTINIGRHAPKKYATEAEKKEAQELARKNRAELMKLLKAAHKARMASNKAEAEKLDAEAAKYYNA